MHTYIPPHRFFPYLTWTDIEAMPDKENVVILQPIGAIEQHGPHLPLVVDAAIATAVVGKALEQLPEEIPAYALPTQCYGKSNEHSDFPGTITLSSTTLIATLMELGKSLYRAGFRKLVFVNGHGGQPQILEIVARDLHEKYENFCVFPILAWSVPNCAAEFLSPKELELGIHAGDAETSVLLSILPDHVQMDRALQEYPNGLPGEQADNKSILTMEGPRPFAWMTRDLSQSGVIGDPTVATKEKGDRLLQTLGQSWVQLIQDIHQFVQPSPL
ncbi:MAG: creatininase family protein [Cyanobacteria bacterium P01_F01_bin.150]